MKISILTLFPEMFAGPFDYSILKKAKENKLITIEPVNIRNFGIGKHQTVDDTPYGGGKGMVLRVDVLDNAIQAVKDPSLSEKEQKVILLSARGKTFDQAKARSFATLKHLILVCGHYEGVDERILQFIDEELSVGNFVTTGGEIPAMLITDAVARLTEGVLKTEAKTYESFSPELAPESKNTTEENYLEYPQYTKPPAYKNLVVPDILLSGNHQKIAAWKKSKVKKAASNILP